MAHITYKSPVRLHPHLQNLQTVTATSHQGQGGTEEIELNLTNLELRGNLTPRHAPNQRVTTCSAGLKRKHRVQGPLLPNSWLNLNKGVKNGC